MKFTALQALCRERKLDTKGNKAALAERLAANDRSPAKPAQTITAQLQRAAAPPSSGASSGTGPPLRRSDRLAIEQRLWDNLVAVFTEGGNVEDSMDALSHREFELLSAFPTAADFGRYPGVEQPCGG